MTGERMRGRRAGWGARAMSDKKYPTQSPIHRPVTGTAATCAPPIAANLASGRCHNGIYFLRASCTKT